MGRSLLRVLLLLLPVSQAPAVAPPVAALPLTEELARPLETPQPEAQVMVDCQPAPANELGLVAACDVRPLSR